MTTNTNLQQGISQLGLSISSLQIEQLEAYLKLLDKWNRAYNLTAVRDPERMISHHLLDSLSLIPHLNDAKNMLDVGSGGGMPGIPSAIINSNMHVTLIDSNHKKTTFLRQVVMELSLSNVEIITDRVENFSVDKKFDCIVSRAFAELAEFINLTKHLLAENGEWLAMKGVFPYEEIDQLDPLSHTAQVIKLEVPGLDAQRHLVRVQNIKKSC